MTTLYHINEKLEELLYIAQDFDSDTPPETVDNWMAEFAEQKGEQKDKLESIMIVRQNAINSQNGVSFEIERLQTRLKEEKRLEAKMTSLLDRFMEVDELKEVKTDKFLAKYRNLPPKMILSDELTQTLIEKHQVDTQTEKLKEVRKELAEDKKKIKNMLKDGKEIDGAELVRGKKLIIK